MISFSQGEILALVGQWLYPFVRVGGTMMAAPLIGTRVVPGRIRIILAIAISFVIVPLVPPVVGIQIFSLESLLVTAQQLTIGIVIGLVLRLTFVVVEFAGQIIAQQMGLGFASLVDPQTGLQVPVLSQYYIVLATLVFLALDGHLLLISVLSESFFVMPVGLSGISAGDLGVILEWTSFLFSGSLAIALPAVIALLVVNLAFGVMARSAPQLNIFAVGFPVMILFGVFVSYLTLDNLSTHLRIHFDMAFAVLKQIISF